MNTSLSMQALMTPSKEKSLMIVSRFGREDGASMAGSWEPRMRKNC